MKKFKINDAYPWKYYSLGGVTRVKITSGEDIAHLGLLDKKKWTALSCPTTLLEFDAATLAFLDTNEDGYIREPEVIAAAEWLTAQVTDKDSVLKGADTISLDELTAESPVATALKTLEMESVSLGQIAELKSTLSSAAADGVPETVEAPFGDATEGVIAAYKSLQAKVTDYFTRCHLIAFNAACAEALDDSVAKITAIASQDLSSCGSQIAECPIATPTAQVVLPVAAGLNPQWKGQVATLAAGCGLTEGITEEVWKAIGEKITVYEGAVASSREAVVASFQQSHKERWEAVVLVDRFLHLYRWFYSFLQNFITFDYFYAKDMKAMFQAGTLYIDQRSCELCIKVHDMGRHGDMAGLSGMYILYCKCVSKVKNATIDIAAIVTDGDVDGLRVGKNGIFFDNDGNDWSAEIVKIVENPISVRQAFFSPYKRFSRWCSEKINKMASDKEAKSFDNLAKGADAKIALVTTNPNTDVPKAQAFDVAKFAGIFAAIGLAIGAIGGFLASFFEIITQPAWAAPIYIVGIMLLISLPSMFIAWTKLRKRDLGPVLNANGWAINAKVLVNVKFGATLTHLVKYPLLKGVYDPYAVKKMPCWAKWLTALVIVAGIAVLLYFTDCFGLYSIHDLLFPGDPTPIQEVAETITETVPATE